MSRPIRSILVQGPGAVGRFMASRFASAPATGVSCTLLDRDRDRADRLAGEGIRVVDQRSGDRDTVPIDAIHVDDPETRRWDLLITCVKAQDSAPALRQGVTYLKRDGLVLVLSNGLGNLESAERVWPREQCLGGTISCGVDRSGVTGVRIHGEGKLRVGTRRDAPSSWAAERRLAEITGLFRTASLCVEQVSDIEAVIWEKVAINCAINPLGSLFRVENGELPHLPAFSWGVGAAREVARVARVVPGGARLPIEGWRDRIAEICTATATNRCSMLVDLEHSRRTEIAMLCGRVGELGASMQIATPFNDGLTTMVQSLERLANCSNTAAEVRDPKLTTEANWS